MRPSRFPSPLLALALALVACPARRAPVGPTAVPSSSLAASSAPSAPTSAIASASASATASATSASGTGAADLARCGVVAPVFSEDACAADVDCAPVAVCHPTACVAVAKAGTMKPGTMCTADCRPGTLDCGCNRCGCVARADGQKRCALAPRAGR